MSKEKNYFRIIFLLSFLSFFIPFFSAQAIEYQRVSLGDTIRIGEFLFEDDYTASTADCTLTIYNPAGTLKYTGIMTEDANGWHYHDFAVGAGEALGNWPTSMACGTAGVDLVIADKTFTVIPTTTTTNDAIAGSVWNTATANLTTGGSIGKAFADNRVIKFNANGEVAAGSGTNNYRAKLYINDLSTQPVSPTASPSVTLYGPAGTVQAGPTNMTKDEKGIYSYQTTLGSGATVGRWEAVATITTVTGNTIKVSGYFEVESSPAQVIINSITDNTVPSIVANVTITNEGSVGNEYQYEYCIVTTLENKCGGGDDVAYALAAKFINPGDDFITNLALTANTPGTYFFKVVVYWSTERSVAVKQFTAVSEEISPTPTPTPAPGGGGGGGGGGGVPAPTPTTIPAVYSSANFNNDGIVDSVDFSILLYFWKTQPPFRNSYVDINKDGQVNSVDFSIMLYQWGKPGS